MKKQILVPIDLSDYSKAGLESAIKIAKSINAELNVLHVIEEEKPVGINTTADITMSQNVQAERNRYIIELMQRKQKQLINFLQPYQKDSLELKTFIEVGDYTDSLQTIVSENDVDLIVMGTSGETSLTELYSGNHAEQTTREISVPVLSITPDQGIDKFNTVGFLVDLENPNQQLISLIKSVCKVMNLDLVILHKKEIEFLDNSELIIHLRLLAREYGLSAKAIVIMNENGNFVDDIKEAISKHGIDILAKTVEKQSAIARLFFENITDELINEINEPVLLMSN